MEKPHNSLTAPADYWHESARPLTSLLFVLPLLVVYEVAALAVHSDAARNGVDIWLRYVLDGVGFGQFFLLPLATCGILLAWHHVTRDKWRCAPSVLGVMLAESLFLGILLMALAQLNGWVFMASTPANTPTPETQGRLANYVVGSIGAGIYEELLFRLMMLPAVIAVLRWLGEPRRASLMTGVILTSLIFSAAHFQIFTGYGEAFDWFSFTFRTLAGSFFASLFVLRGFGVTVGAHVVYDIFVGVFFFLGTN